MMRSKVLVAALALGLAACHSSTAPKYPALVGTYNSFFTLTFNNAANTGQNGSTSLLGTITIDSLDGQGRFTGSYLYTSGGFGSGTMAGGLQGDGSITVTQFGDSGEAFGNQLAFLQNTWPNCDFSQATDSTPFARSVSGGTLVLNGVVAVSCNYLDPEDQNEGFPTTITDGITGTRT